MICFQDVTARRQADIKSERTEAHYRAIVATAVDGMVVIDEQGIIQSFNPAAERLFGYGADEVIGRNVTVLMPERDRTVHDGYIWNYRRGSDRNVIGRGRELQGCRKDGSTFPLELSVAEWRDGRQRFFTGFMSDVSARREALRQIPDFDRRVDDVDHLVLVVLVRQEDAAGCQHAAGTDMDADLPIRKDGADGILVQLFGIGGYRQMDPHLHFG